MLQSHSESVALSHRTACSFLIIEQTTSILEVCDLGTFLHHVVDRTVIEVVSCKVHLVVQQSEGTVETTHPRCGDTVSAAPTAHAHTHSAATAAHALHHAAGHVVESAVVGIVSIENDADLTLVSKTTDHRSTLISPVIHIGSGSRNIVTAATHDVSEPALHHSRLHSQVDDCLMLTVIDTGKDSLI